MAYADYDYYIGEYLLGREAVIPEASFSGFEKDARREVDERTFGRIADNAELITDAVRDCVCAIAEVLFKAECQEKANAAAGMAGALTSWSNDGQSGTVDVTGSIYTVQGRRAEIRRLIHAYLGRTGLLYAGVSVYEP